MPAEQLNIKLKLDTTELNTGIKKAKTKLTEMASAAQKSIPKINTESNKASKALKDVSEAGGKVKKTLDDIGGKAKSGLSSITTESNKITSAFQKLGLAGRVAKTGMNVDSTATSLEEMKDTMQNIARIDLFGALAAQSSKFANVFKGVKNAVKQAQDSLALLKKQFQQSAEHWENYKVDVAWGMEDDVAAERLQLINNEFRKINIERKKVFKNLLTSLKAVGVEVLKLVKALAMVGAAFTAFVLPINAFSVSKLAKEVDAAAQRVGFSTKAYQEWSYVLDRAGIEAGQLIEVMKTLTEAQIDVVKGEKEFIAAFEKLGMTQEQVASMSQEQLWNATIAALQNMEDTTMRNVVAQRIFEEDMSKLAPLLNMTNADTQSLIATYEALGATMSADLIQKSNQLQAAVANLRAAWQGLRNTLAQAVIPAVVAVVNALTKAIIIVNTFLQVIFGFDLSSSLGNLNAGFSGGAGAADDYADSVGGAASALDKLRKATMGFDELNVLPSQPESGGGGSGSGGGSFGGGGGISLPSNSVFDEATNDLVAFREKVFAFMEKWKTQLQVIAGALAGLTVAGLIGSFGNAIGLGENFLGIINNIKQAAGAVITITLQYMAVNEFLDNYLDGEGFKNWIYAALSTALGSLILWSMWGATGLAIGLGITAYVSLDAIFEEGGITDIESGIVALTGLATAIGAVYIAWTKAGFGTLFAGLLAKFPALTTGFTWLKTTLVAIVGGIPKAVGAALSGIGSVIGNAISLIGAVIDASLLGIPSKILTTIGGWIGTLTSGIASVIGKALGGVGKAITAMGGGWAVAIVAAIAAALTLAIVQYDFTDIGYKLGHALGSAIKKVGDFFSGAWDVITSIGTGIKNCISSACAWVAEQFDFLAEIDLIDLFKLETWSEIIIPKVKEIGGNILRGIVEGIKNGWDNFWGNIQEFIDGFVQGWKDALGIASPSTVFAEIGGFILDGLLNGLKTGWTNITAWFESTIAPKFTKEYWNTKFESVRAAADEKLTATKQAIQTKWEEVRAFFNSSIAPKFTKEYWNTKFDTIRQAANEKLEQLKQLFTTVWSAITSWFSANVSPKFTADYWATKFNSIKDGAKTVLNSLIGIIEGAANSIIGKVNSISFTAPSWVPGYGGKTIGFNLKTISIPRLANGGITTGSTIANIGEKGTEMVLPLTGTQGSAWMDMLADKIASRNQAPSKIVLAVDGRELGWAAINNINGITEQTGGLQLVI